MTTAVMPPVPSFLGILREDGRVATRNMIGVFVVGNCGATAARMTAKAFTARKLQAFPNIDGVVPFVHEIGCGMEMTGEPMNLLRRTIAGTIRNPNIGGAVVIALGCERNNIDGFLEQEGLQLGPRLVRVVMQEEGGTQAAVARAVAAIEAMLPAVNAVHREPVPASRLVVGLQTIAGDDLAGPANRAMGAAVDRLVACGGTVLLSGTSGLAPLQSALAARAATPQVGEQLAQRIDWWRRYSEGRDTKLTRQASEAPRALQARAEAAARRAGHAPLAAVTDYARAPTTNGLVFMDAPEYEAISATGQIAAGATLVSLATGRASAFSSLPAPTVRLAASSALFSQYREDLDLDCGPLADGRLSDEEMGEQVLSAWLRHASGERSKAEELGLGDNEFVPWPIGVLA